MSGAEAAINLLASRLTFSEEECFHRHGPQKAKAFGFSHGGGQMQPGMLRVGSKSNAIALQDFLEDPNIKRLAGFASCKYHWPSFISTVLTPCSCVLIL